MRFAFIVEYRQHYPITLLCKALDVSVSGYYAWCQREVSEHQREDARLSAEIQHIFLEHRQVYGSPRIHAVLKARGIQCSRTRVVRLMQQLGLSAGHKRSRKPTTKSDPRARCAPNRLNREFAAAEPKSKWVTDTKAVETAEGWFYLAVILDLFSRMVVAGPWRQPKMSNSSNSPYAWQWSNAILPQDFCIIPIAAANVPAIAIWLCWLHWVSR